MTRTLLEIRTELEQLHQENQKAIEKYTTDLEAINHKIEQAKQDIAEAQKKADAKTYDKAKRELWTAENTKEMLKNKLDELTKPLLTKEKMQAVIEEIKAIAESNTMDIIRELEKLFPEFDKLKKKHFENIELANNILEILGRGNDYTPRNSITFLLDRLIENYERITK